MLIIVPWGKIIGGCFGFLFGGFLGALLGIFVGHIFDRGLRLQMAHKPHTPEEHAHIQAIFFETTFTVMAHLAKTDGRITENDIRVANAVMQRMGLNEPARQQAIRFFNIGKQAGFDLNTALEHLLQHCRGNLPLLQLFIEIQIETAYAEGELSDKKKEVLYYIGKKLGYAPLYFAFFEALYKHRTSQQYQSQGDSSRTFSAQKPSLQQAYQVLGITETASIAQVKSAYRKLISQNHPDKLIAQGLPDNMIKLATEKTQRIRAAYEQILAAKGNR